MKILRHKWLLALLLLIPALAYANGPAMTTVQDTIYGPDGSLANGTVTVRAANPFTSADGYAISDHMLTRATITNGVLSMQLVPNAGSTPTSYYVALFNLGVQTGNGGSYVAYWVVPSSSTPVNLATVRVASPPSLGPVVDFPQLNPPPGCLATQNPQWLNPGWGCSSASGLTNPMTTLGDTLYQGSLNAPVRLAGNTSTTPEVLCSTGTGTAAAAPLWSSSCGNASMVYPGVGATWVSATNTWGTPYNTNCATALTFTAGSGFGCNSSVGGLFRSFQIASNAAITTGGNYIQWLAGTNVTFGYTGSGTSGSPYQVTINATASGSLPPCTTDQLIYYAASGTTGTCLNIGANLSITGTTLNASAGSGGGGIGGGTANSPGATDHVVNVINYGAVDEGGSVYDAALASFGTEWGTTANSTAVASPGGTTVFANEVDLSVVTWGYTNFSSGPSGSGITQQVKLSAGTGCCYGLWMGTQTIATAGAITTTTGTLSASDPWEATEIPLIPKSGQTISVVNVATAQPGNASTITINVPSGTVAGDAMLACFATGYDGTNIFKTYAGWSPVVDIHNTANSGSDLACQVHVATASEPASYTFTSTSGNNYPSGAIITLSNVAAIQTPITSATGAFTSAMTGDPSCISVSDPGGMNQACGPVFYGSSTTAYPLYGNPSSTAISAANFRWAHDDTSAFDAAITAISSSGGELYIPAGTYGITAPLTLLPCCKTVDIVGAGDAVTENVMGVTGNTFTPAPPSGSSLLILTNNMGGGAIQIQGTVDANGDSWSFTAQDILENFSMWAGAGTYRNGGEAPGYMVCPSQYVGNLGFCSGDGIDIGLSHVTIDHVAIGNFAGNGISVSADPSHYTWLVTVRNSRLTLNGGDGLAIWGGYYTGDTHSSIDNHTDRVVGNDIWENGGCGVFEGTANNASTGVHILNVDIRNNDMEWNNQAGANPGAELCLGTNAGPTSMGGVISDNLFETSQANTTNVRIGSEFKAPGLVFIGNSFWFDPGTDAAPIYLYGATSIVLQGNFTSLNYSANPDNSWFSGPGSLVDATVDNTNSNLQTPSFGTTVTGTAGTAACSINDQGGNLRASCYLNGYAQTGTAQTWTFPIPFVTAPIVLETGGSCGSYNPTSTATVLTLPANASMTAETCEVMVMGQD